MSIPPTPLVPWELEAIFYSDKIAPIWRGRVPRVTTPLSQRQLIPRRVRLLPSSRTSSFDEHAVYVSRSIAHRFVMKSDLPSPAKLYHELPSWEIDACARTLLRQQGWLAPLAVLDAVDVFVEKRDWQSVETWRLIGLRLGTLLCETPYI